MTHTYPVPGWVSTLFFVIFGVGFMICLAGGAWLSALIVEKLTDRVVRCLRMGWAIMDYVVAKHQWGGRSPVDIIRDQRDEYSRVRKEMAELREQLEAAYRHRDGLLHRAIGVQREIDALREQLEAAEACAGDDDAALSEAHNLWVHAKCALAALLKVAENHMPTRGSLYDYEITALDRAHAILNPKKEA